MEALLLKRSQAVPQVSLVLVQPLVVADEDGVVVEEDGSREVRERGALAVKVEGPQAAFEDAIDRIALHLLFQVLPIVAEVAVLKDAVMKVEHQLAKPFARNAFFRIFS